MAIVKSDPAAETVGVKPALVWTVIGLALCAVIVCAVDKALVGDDIEDAVWQTLFAAIAPVAAAAAAAPAALQKRR